MKDQSNQSKNRSKESSLWFALLLTGGFLIAEVIGGIITGSLALLSDAAHMLTDVTALIISLVAIYVGKKPADASRTYGYYRFEILAATFNAALLFVVALFILFEAYKRLKNPPEIYSMGMLVIALLGLIINFIAIKLLSHGKESSLNLKSAYLEVWSDMLSSLGVIIAALIIHYTHLAWIDSLVAVLIGLWVLPRTWQLLKESINILLEGVPEGMDIKNIETTILSVADILDVHDLHIWAITNDKISLTAHLVTQIGNEENIRTEVQKVLSEQFNIIHTTLQLEQSRTPTCEVH
ncbi:cation diffusion facilitator family transporter [Fluoribacter dumoffii]|uniref:Cation efflux system protein n=2 Tax=Legionellaceae TaxID=444 RepID=A0A0W0SDY0_9GAMM|nr:MULTISPECIES: cation diffusion facilitator family transporter [Legionellaceae]HAT1993798.1 cation transporter [Legionella pneumophila]KTC81093.1 cation efflux system protein [Legionella cherrii]KTC91301.1 cation efflux system protein [Fluoribacter dumoffii NY 23]MCW8416923.1 cation diffusion facilitator family transporter [Fluoribacter dumoffii]MCW8455237.1 cation diffusion facilitator family transporter [Fluoribacter dumoffii]